MARYKREPSVQVAMRLPQSIVMRLDELVTSTGGTRSDVIRALVAQARVKHVTAEVPTIVLEAGEASAKT